MKDNSQDFKHRFYWYSQQVMAGKYQVDDDNREALKQFCTIMDPEPEEGEVSHQGVLLMGNPGSGKDLMFKIAQRVVAPPFHHKRFPLYNALGLSAEYAGGGYEVIAVKMKGECCISEIGAETGTKNYGNLLDVVKQLVMLRYEMFQDKGIKTHFSTNLNFEELEARYDSRFVSRLQEMCVKIVLPVSKDNDRRKYATPVSWPEFPWHIPGISPEMRTAYENYKYTPSEMRTWDKNGNEITKTESRQRDIEYENYRAAYIQKTQNENT